MKFITLLICLSLSIPCFAQTELEIKYAKDACDCMNNLKVNNNFTQENFANCFETALQLNEDLVQEEILRIYGDTSYESGYQFGNELTRKIMIDMVAECTSYFHLMDSMRYEEYKNLDRDSLQAVYTEMIQADEDAINEKFLEKRALLAFHLKKYEHALVDISSVLEINPDNGQSIFLKGWIYDINGEYDAAKRMYDQVAEVTMSKTFLIFSEVVKRKKKESLKK